MGRMPFIGEHWIENPAWLYIIFAVSFIGKLAVKNLIFKNTPFLMNLYLLGGLLLSYIFWRVSLVVEKEARWIISSAVILLAYSVALFFVKF